MQLSIKYRPQRFYEVVGQNASVRILTNSILIERVPKSILMSGIRGIGKTTLARLYAKALNCENFLSIGDTCTADNPHECVSCQEIRRDSHLSVLELDVASNNGVDDIRRLEELLLQKMIHSYRVIILDEVHMLSKQAQAALLKTLEEPPPRNVFILVTTDPEKLEDTVRSRCLSLSLRACSPGDIARSISNILELEGKSYERSFVDSLSLHGGGSLRDAQQLLDQVIISAGGEPLTVDLLEETCGIVSTERYKDLASVFLTKDLKYAIEEVERWYREGVDLSLLLEVGVPNLVRDFSVYLAGAYSDLVYYRSGLSHKAMMRNFTLSKEEVHRIIKEWEVSYKMMRETSNQVVIMQTFFAKIFGG